MLLVAVTTALALARAPLAPSDEAARALEAALQRSRPALRAAALDLASSANDAALAAAIFPALSDPDEEVRRAALAALGRSTAPNALDALLGRARSGAAELRAHPLELATLLHALGRHADPRSLPALTSDALHSLEPEPLRARILALGRIRTRESVDALVALAHALPFAEEQQVLHELRLSFAVLTGQTPGYTAASLVHWWGEQRASFAVPAELPALAPSLERRWRAAWPERATP
ncbi:MAG: HEAT repeat domain-containing protein [Planctomycetes bacterium]|nr:HEAT repeat domain-containing protein [Planctomycetota bacterium]